MLISDGGARLQVYVRKNDVGDEAWALYNKLDLGDWVGVEGYLFITKTGELSLHVHSLQFLAKGLLPMPDKYHGVADKELRYRQRYVDLIASGAAQEREEGELTSREVFVRRANIVRAIRKYFDERGYIEVETPMLTPLATGAAARPFKTHHNALDIPLYARIAPELYLKRLVVGGFERVYELNRNFRNEGLVHSPQSRIHDARILSGVFGLQRFDGFDGGVDYGIGRRSLRHAADSVSGTHAGFRQLATPDDARSRAEILAGSFERQASQRWMI